MSIQFMEWIQETPFYQAMVTVGYFPVWCNDGDEWSIEYWSIPYAPLTYYERVGERIVRKERVFQKPYEDCPLHQALMNTGYELYRKQYCVNGRDTGKFVAYYAPDYSKKPIPEGCVRDWSAEPRYIRVKGGNCYPVEVVEMAPYTYFYGG
jgi:hypothetical protein